MVFVKHSTQVATLAGLRKLGGTSPARLKDELLGIGSRSSYYRWAKQVLLTGSGHRSPTSYQLRGRPRRLTRLEAEWLVSLHSQHPSLPANTLAYNCLLTTGKYMSTRTVYLYLHRAGRTYKRVEKRAKEAKPEQEALFLLERGNYTPEQIIAVDESHFDPRCENSLYGWAKRGARAIARVLFRHEYSLSAVGVISWNDGLLGVPVVQGSYNAERLIEEVLEPYIFPFSNPYPFENSVILWDNAATHKNREVVKAIEDHQMRILSTPPYSPWFQPCEFLFGAVKNAFRQGRLSLSHPDGPFAAVRAAFYEIIPTAGAAQRFFAHCGIVEGM
ncbi:hypothetical protein JCM5296_006729 [Sporobolomyces johnsonii]